MLNLNSLIYTIEFTQPKATVPSICSYLTPPPGVTSLRAPSSADSTCVPGLTTTTKSPYTSCPFLGHREDSQAWPVQWPRWSLGQGHRMPSSTPQADKHTSWRALPGQGISRRHWSLFCLSAQHAEGPSNDEFCSGPEATSVLSRPQEGGSSSPSHRGPQVLTRSMG